MLTFATFLMRWKLDRKPITVTKPAFRIELVSQLTVIRREHLYRLQYMLGSLNNTICKTLDPDCISASILTQVYTVCTSHDLGS